MTNLAMSVSLLAALLAAEPARPEAVALTDAKEVVLPADAGQVHGTPRWAPDGALVAFVTVRAGQAPATTSTKPAAGPRSYDIWTAKADGSDLTRRYQAAAPGEPISDLAWTSSGLLLFNRRSAAGQVLTVVDCLRERSYTGPSGPLLVIGDAGFLVSRVDGVHRISVSARVAETICTAAPPAGAIYDDLAATRTTDFLLGRIGNDTHVLFPDRTVRVIKDLTLAAASPDGGWIVGHVPTISPTTIALTVGAALYKVDAQKKTVEKVRDLLSPTEYLGGWEALRPRWSADSKRVQFVAAPMASEGHKFRHWYLYEADVTSGGAPRRLQDLEAFSLKTDCAPDGRWTLLWRKFENEGLWLILRDDASYRKLDTYLMQYAADVSSDGARFAARMEDGKLRIFTLKSLATRPAK